MAFPSPAADSLEDRIDLNRQLVKRPAATFFVRYTGGGEAAAKELCTGDILIVDRSLTPADGDLVVARLDDEYLVGVLRLDEGSISLQTGDGGAVALTERDFAIWGQVLHFIRSFPPAASAGSAANSAAAAWPRL